MMTQEIFSCPAQRMGIRLSYARIKINEIQGLDFFLLDACNMSRPQKSRLNLGPQIPATVRTEAKGMNLNCASTLLGTVPADLQTQDTNFYRESSNEKK